MNKPNAFDMIYPNKSFRQTANLEISSILEPETDGF